jgi:ATP-independent RNA helicase DbpA
VLVVCGGLPLRDQIDALNSGVHIVVGTPGRMLDLIKRDRFPCQDVRTLILDEADQMLDLGFEEDMTLILSELPETRQTAFFSATYPDSIQQLSQKYQHKPVQITIEESTETKADITQGYFTTEREEKIPMLMRILRRADPESALVFCNLKTTVAEIGLALNNEHFSVVTLTGDLEQRDRDAVMAKFRNGSVRILVATDVAARGLDIEDLPMVVNFDLPGDPEIYVHRIGRTGRAGKSGLAYSFVPAADMILLDEIQTLTGRPFEKATLPPKVQHQQPPRPAEMRTLLIGGGRKDKVRPGDLLGALTGEAGGFQKNEIGKIEIHDHCSYVAVREEIAKSAVRGLSQGRIKGHKFPVFLLD